LQAILGLLSNGQSGTSGLSNVVKMFTDAGHGDKVNSWVGTGENKAIAPDQLASVLGDDKINAIAQRLGLSGDDARSKLSELIPQMIDKMTPNGRIE
jgi:uncharacterized protein YidB (DUF937 family)